MLEHLDRLFVLGTKKALLKNVSGVLIDASENQTNRDNQQERLLMTTSNKISSNVAWYLSGFVDGEGSFNISLRKKSDYRIGWQPVLSFNVSQRERTLLDLMKSYYQCGIIKRRKDGLHSYDVTNPSDLKRKIIPFFDQYSFLSKRKQANYLLFKKAVDLMLSKEHLEIEGFIRLLDIRESINKGKGRTRKYTKQDVLKLIESPETIRQEA